jgi:hypothetical protein
VFVGEVTLRERDLTLQAGGNINYYFELFFAVVPIDVRQHVDPTLHQAIATSYRPHCKFRGWLFHLPNDVQPPRNALAQQLGNIGCSAVVANPEMHW